MFMRTVFIRRKLAFIRKLSNKRIIFVVIIIATAIFWPLSSLFETSYIKIDNADFPNVGDFSCPGSIRQTSCTFAIDRKDLDKYGTKKCNALGKICEGFVMNQGMKTITLKNNFRGDNIFAAGMSVFIKKTSMSHVNITEMFEVCADSLTFFAVKVDGSDVKVGICLYENLFTDSYFDVTSVNFNSKKVYEDEIFGRKDILQFFSGESKDYEFVKSPQENSDKFASSKTRRCNLPDLDPFDKSIMGVMFKPSSFSCPGQHHLTSYQNGMLSINPQLVSKADWRVVKVKPEEGSKYISSSSGSLNQDQPQVLIKEDMIRVDVTATDGHKQTDMHLKISPKPEVLKRPVKDGLQALNIIMIGFDSTSHSHFQRKLGKVYTYLKDDLKSFIFNGYSIVGDGTTPALLALLTGKKEEELPEGRYRIKGAKCLDDWPWIYKTFKEHGYATMYSEDEVDLGAFTYRLMGFCNPPMDHYLLPYWFSAIDAETSWFKLGVGSLRGHCVGAEAIHNVSLEMVESMFKAYPRTPKFGLNFFSDICHSRLNDLSLIEDDVLAFLKTMKNQHYLDNTILVLFGDHGIRFGSIRSTVIGKMEERLPFLSITLPQWFEKRYPKLVKNLRANIDVLTTPLDVHATFSHILSYPSLPTHLSFGKSLFTNVGERSCKESGIPTHFCPCMEWTIVDVKHDHIKKSAQAIIRNINGLITKNGLTGKCALLNLKQIKSAVKITPNEDVETYEKAADQDGRKVLKGARPKGVCHYQLQIITSPNNGIFEATVSLSSGATFVNPQLSRIDRYGDQPKCIIETHHHMREYCYCR